MNKTRYLYLLDHFTQQATFLGEIVYLTDAIYSLTPEGKSFRYTDKLYRAEEIIFVPMLGRFTVQCPEEE